MSHKRKHAASDRTTAALPAVDDLLPRTFFSVTGAPDYADEEPQTVEEYLRRVKFEARAQPRVFASAIDPRRFDHLQTKGYVRSIQPLPPTTRRVMPSAEWESEFAAQFADIRLSFAHYSQLHPPADPQPRPPVDASHSPTAIDEAVSPARNSESWARYCLGLSSPATPAPAPSLPTVAAFDQLTTRSVLAHIVAHVQQQLTRAQTLQRRQNKAATQEQKSSDKEEARDAGAELAETEAEAGDEHESTDEEGEEEEEGREAESRLQPSSTPGPPSSRLHVLPFLSASTARWLYCLLAHLQRPLPSEAEVQLRQLYRVCGNVRAEVGNRLTQLAAERCEEGKQDDAEQHEERERVKAAEETAMWCNMLLTIVDRIFGQRIPVQVLPAG